eukprot:gene9888-7766_t
MTSCIRSAVRRSQPQHSGRVPKTSRWSNTVRTGPMNSGSSHRVAPLLPLDARPGPVYVCHTSGSMAAVQDIGLPTQARRLKRAPATDIRKYRPTLDTRNHACGQRATDTRPHTRPHGLEVAHDGPDAWPPLLDHHPAQHQRATGPGSRPKAYTRFSYESSATPPESHGFFPQPRLVEAKPNILATLPTAELQAQLAERGAMQGPEDPKALRSLDAPARTQATRPQHTATRGRC